jgi:hypothetical protein
MSDRIDEMLETLRRIERLLTRFELDTTARLHPIDYGASIVELCSSFQEQMRGLLDQPSEGHHADSRSRSEGMSRMTGRSRGD